MWAIKQLSADAVLPVRHQVLWPDRPAEFSRLPLDDQGQHWGAFGGEVLLGVVSVFSQAHEAQFRKLAVLPQAQKLGIGAALLNHVFVQAASQAMTVVWCDARMDATPFYERLGMVTCDKPFEKNGLLFVRMKLSLPR